MTETNAFEDWKRLKNHSAATEVAAKTAFRAGRISYERYLIMMEAAHVLVQMAVEKVHAENQWLKDNKGSY